MRTDDLIQPFQIESMVAQGRLVRLGGVMDAILSAHAYPEPVALLLGECLTLAAVLSGSIKYDGVLTLQISGEGPVSILVADVTSEGGMRGFAQFKRDRVEAALADAANQSGPVQPVPLLLGKGHLAFTVDQGPDTQRYQGLVALEGATLVDCAHGYLRQSVQLDAAVKIAVGRVAGSSGMAAWRAGGLMVQRTPDIRRQRMSGDPENAEEEDAWRRAVILMGSSTNDELLDPALHPHRLLYRLFNEDGVRVFEPTALSMSCRCSRERVERVLRSFPRAEIESMKVDGRVVVTCEFCNAVYSFDEDTLAVLYTP